MNSKGAVAQMEERLPRTEEAGGSNPLCSIFFLDRIEFRLMIKAAGLFVGCAGELRQGWKAATVSRALLSGTKLAA